MGGVEVDAVIGVDVAVRVGAVEVVVGDGSGFGFVSMTHPVELRT